MKKILIERLQNIDSSIYVQEVFDTVQTHAVYCVTEENKEKIKTLLKENGCNRFRVVKSHSKVFNIICFKFNKESKNIKPINKL